MIFKRIYVKLCPEIGWVIILVLLPVIFVSVEVHRNLGFDTDKKLQDGEWFHDEGNYRSITDVLNEEAVCVWLQNENKQHTVVWDQ